MQTRRTLLTAAAAALAPATTSGAAMMMADSVVPVHIFSKHLQFLPQGPDLLKAVRDLGFTGVDLTVRKGGHILPERVAQDLPPLMKAARDLGVRVDMVTTDIVDASTPNAERVLDAMAQQNIRIYRWGGFKYDADGPVRPQLDGMRGRVEKLAALNAKYKAKAIYHTHSGRGQTGASVWDAWLLVRDFDPQSVAVNYDAGHACIEGGYGGWNHSLRVLGPHLGGVAVKDFLWERNAAGTWRPAWKPLGEGMTPLKEVGAMLRQMKFEGPIQLHFEYPLGGADTGKATLTVDREQVYAGMRRDLSKLRALWGLVAA